VLVWLETLRSARELAEDLVVSAAIVWAFAWGWVLRDLHAHRKR